MREALTLAVDTKIGLIEMYVDQLERQIIGERLTDRQTESVRSIVRKLEFCADKESCVA